MTNMLRMTEAQLSEITRRNNPRRIDLANIRAPVKVSLRGPRSPKGVAGGMTAEQDKAARLERQRAKRAADRARSERRRKAKVPVPSEHSEQVAVIQWWHVFAAQHHLDVRLLFAIPNGSHKSFNQAALYKAEGLRPGVPDLFLAIPPPPFQGYPVNHGLFIEMKSKAGRVSPEQADYGQLLRRTGYRVEVCFGADSAILAVQAYLGLSVDAGKAQEGQGSAP